MDLVLSFSVTLGGHARGETKSTPRGTIPEQWCHLRLPKSPLDTSDDNTLFNQYIKDTSFSFGNFVRHIVCIVCCGAISASWGGSQPQSTRHSRLHRSAQIRGHFSASRLSTSEQSSPCPRSEEAAHQGHVQGAEPQRKGAIRYLLARRRRHRWSDPFSTSQSCARLAPSYTEGSAFGDHPCARRRVDCAPHIHQIRSLSPLPGPQSSACCERARTSWSPHVT